MGYVSCANDLVARNRAGRQSPYGMPMLCRGGEDASDMLAITQAGRIIDISR